MARYIYQNTFKDGNGRVVSGGTVSVYLAGTTTAASVYTSATGGSAVNSVTSDSDGHFYFYVDTDDYEVTQRFDIKLSKSGYQDKTYSNIAILGPDEVLSHYEDVFKNFCTTWSDSDASGIFPSKTAHIVKSSDYTVTESDVFLQADGDSSTVTFTLEPASTAGKGRIVIFKATNIVNTVSIVPDGTDTIENLTSYTFSYPNEVVVLMSNGTSDWHIADRYIPSPFPVAAGGTGATTLTDHGILLGSGTSAVTALGEATDGQIPIGSTGNDPVLATLTAGNNISITNAAGAVTIAVSGDTVKAWINFDGTSDLSGGSDLGRASYGVSDVADNGTGDYTISWSTAFSSNGFAVGAFASTLCYVTCSSSSDTLAESIRIITRDAGGTATDPDVVTVIAIGNQ